MIQPALFESFLDGLLQGDRQKCREIVSSLMARNVSDTTLYIDLFSRALYEIGDRWEHGQISVAVEHLVTAQVEDLLGLVFANQPRATSGEKAIVFCGTDELHQVGARIVADTLEGMGWDVDFLGAGTPLQDLLEHVSRTEPSLVAISVTLESHVDLALDILRTLRKERPNLLLLAGGQAVQRQKSRFTELPDVLAPDSLHDLGRALQ